MQSLAKMNGGEVGLMKVSKALVLVHGVCVLLASLSVSRPAQADGFYALDGAGWMVRLRGIGVLPEEGSSGWVLDGSRVTGADVGISDTVVPELDITYFFNKNIAVELILAVTPHDVDGTGPLIQGFGKIGDVWLLPPTLTLQYHFDQFSGFKPYVGAGVNYTIFFNEDSGKNYSNLKLENSFGFALQAGVDIHLHDNWYFNVDVKKLWLDTEASVRLDPVVPGRVRADVDIDPWIVGVGLGYRFGGIEAPLK